MDNELTLTREISFDLDLAEFANDNSEWWADTPSGQDTAITGSAEVDATGSPQMGACTLQASLSSGNTLSVEEENPELKRKRAVRERNRKAAAKSRQNKRNQLEAAQTQVANLEKRCERLDAEKNILSDENKSLKAQLLALTNKLCSLVPTDARKLSAGLVLATASASSIMLQDDGPPLKQARIFVGRATAVTSSSPMGFGTSREWLLFVLAVVAVAVVAPAAWRITTRQPQSASKDSPTPAVTQESLDAWKRRRRLFQYL